MNSSSSLPSPSLTLWVYLIYALHAFSVLTGVLSPTFIITAFLTGWPSLLAVLLSYLKRAEAEDGYLESHINWLISTFWFSLMWLLIAGLCMVTIIGIIPGFVILCCIGLWLIYRLLKGFSHLLDERPIVF